MIQNWVNFLMNEQSEIESKDKGINGAQYLLMKLSSNNEVKEIIRAREKYALYRAKRDKILLRKK